MNWERFAITWAGLFRPFQPRDTALMKSLRELVELTPEDVLKNALPELAERYNAAREAGIMPPLPTRWQLENTIRKHTPHQAADCSFCGGSGHVLCIVNKSHEPLALHSAAPGSTLYREIFDCPFCRSSSYRSAAFRETVKACCRPDSVNGSAMLMETMRDER